jgi:hypothetical protein
MLDILVVVGYYRSTIANKRVIAKDVEPPQLKSP